MGITDSSITISFSNPFSGPFASLAQKSYENGVVVWQKEVNARGGIHGRQVIVRKLDNHGTVDGGIAACKEAQSNGSFLVLASISVMSEVDCLDAAGIPVLDRTSGGLKGSWQNVLSLMYLPTLAVAEVSYLKSPYMNAGGKKIGILYTGDNLAVTAEFEAVRDEIRKQGMNFVHAEKVATNQASFVPEMSRLRSAGAEVVMLFTLIESAGAIRDAKAIGYNPQWYAGPYGASTDVVARSAGESYRGIRGLSRVTTTESPAFRAYVEKVRKHQGEAAAAGADTIDVSVYAAADILGKLLELAGPNLTRESFLATARQMEVYNNGLYGPVSWNGRAVGVMSAFPVECCKPDYTFRGVGPAQERF